MKLSAHLVGAYHRPPAPALILALKAGTPLTLRPEPENEYDRYAVQVWVSSLEFAKLSFELMEDLELRLQGYGTTLGEVQAVPEHHLGYLAAKHPRGAEPGTQLSIVIAPLIADKGMPQASLSFAGDGKPIVEMEWP